MGKFLVRFLAVIGGLAILLVLVGLIAGITLRTLVALVILGLLSLPAWKSIVNPADTKAWLMIIIGGGIIAGSLGMWSFYSSLSLSENLGVTLVHRRL